MPISRPGSLLLVGLLVLSACGAGTDATRSAPSQIKLADGTLIAGAEGWCIDEATTRMDTASTVVILGSCAAISGDALQATPETPGIVTISVEAVAGTLPDTESLQKFFVTDEGRAALARNGRSDSVAILDTKLTDGSLYLHATDSSATPGASNEIWRALFGLGGRFVAVSFYARLEDGIQAERALATLEAQVAELKAANQG